MTIFAGIDINLPETFKEKLQVYCRTSGKGHSSLEETPFPRMIDMWFLSMCLALKKGIKPKISEKPQGASYKAMEGVVLGSDSWRSDTLMLIAIAHTQNIEVADNPHEMMRIANGYAQAGLPVLIEALESRGGDTARDFVSDYFEDVAS